MAEDTFSSMVRDFKRSLADRRMPKTLLLLNRMVIIILLVYLLISILLIVLLNNDVDRIEGIIYRQLLSDRRYFQFNQLAIHVNTYVWVANQMINVRFSLDALEKILNRGQNVVNLIQTQMLQVQDLHNEVLQQNRRLNERQDEFDEQLVSMQIVDRNNQIVPYSLPFMSAMNSYFNELNQFRANNFDTFFFPFEYFMMHDFPPGQQYSPTTSAQKSAWFVHANGIRVLREFVNNSTAYQREVITVMQQDQSVLIIMLVSITVTLSSIVVIIFQIKRIEVTQRDIVSLYAYMTIDNIKGTHSKAQSYLSELAMGSFVNQITPKERFEEGKEGFLNNTSKNFGGTINRQSMRTSSNIYTLMIRRIGEELRSISQAKVEQQLRDRGMLQPIIRQPGLHKLREDSHEENTPAVAKERHKGKERRILGSKQGKKFQKALSEVSKKQNEEISSEKSASLESTFNKQTKRKQEEETIEPIGDQIVFTVKERMQQFKKTYKASNGKKNLLLIVTGLILSSMSLLLYVLFDSYIETFKYLAEWVPVIFDRYTYMMVAYVFARERVYMNNTMVSFLETPGYGRNIDMYYNDLSIDIDKLIGGLKLNHKESIAPLIDQMELLDTPLLCESIIKKSSSSLSMYEGSMRKYAVPVGEIPEYQSIIETIYLACDSARRGNLTAIVALVTKFDLNLNLGDYDHCTPLYYAVRGQQLDVVKYLIGTAGVEVNKLDRWGAAPIDYTVRGSPIEAVLLAYGGKRTSAKLNDTSPLPTGVNPLTQNQVRLFYGVYYNSERAVKNLDSEGINIVSPVDIHGRTTLHIACSEGNLNMVRLLIAYGADINSLDKRGNEPKIDTIRGGYQEVYDVINAIQSDTIVKNYCTAFANGVFKKGFQQAKGAFHKKFTDLMLLLNSTDSYLRRVTLVYGGRFNTDAVLLPSEVFSAPRAIPDFQQGYELYWHRIMEQVIEKTVNLHKDLKATFWTQRTVICLSYMSFLCVVMLYMRRKMVQQIRDDIYESRGILNLIPNHFFEQNKPIVEGIMKKLKY